MSQDPHAHAPLLTRGPAPASAQLTLVLLHGRGASAEDILSVYDVLHLDTIAALAPQAAGHTWYPNSFLAPIATNQPYLDSALRRIDALVTDLLAQKIPSTRIAFLGFSQGACLTCEYVARHPRPYAAAIAFTGALIGQQNPANPVTPTFAYPGSLDNTPILLATSDPDPHVPFSRVQQTATTLTTLHAKVDLRRYPNMPHTINQEELTLARTLLQEATATHPR